MSFEDWEGEVVIDYDSNTFSFERDGKAWAYDLDEESDLLARVLSSGEKDVVEYEVYGSE